MHLQIHRQTREQNFRVCIVRANGLGRGHQHMRVFRRVGVALAPIWFDVRLIPNLIIRYRVAVPFCKITGKARVLGKIIRRRAGHVAFVRALTPRGRGVQNGNELNAVRARRIHNAVRLAPVVRAARRFDFAP